MNFNGERKRDAPNQKEAAVWYSNCMADRNKQDQTATFFYCCEGLSFFSITIDLIRTTPPKNSMDEGLQRDVDICRRLRFGLSYNEIRMAAGSSGRGRRLRSSFSPPVVLVVAGEFVAEAST